MDLSCFEKRYVKILHIQVCHKHKPPQGNRTQSIPLLKECLLWFAGYAGWDGTWVISISSGKVSIARKMRDGN